MNFRFVGEDGSMGYRRGQTYNLTAVPFMPYPFAIKPIGRIFDDMTCPYTSLEAFFENWELTKTLTP